MTSGCRCADLPDVHMPRSDDPILRKESLLDASACGIDLDYQQMRVCRHCGQIWIVDVVFHPREPGLAFKVASIEEAKSHDFTADRISYVETAYGGPSERACLWQGCNNRALKELAVCARCAFDRLRIRY